MNRCYEHNVNMQYSSVTISGDVLKACVPVAN